jgi:protein-tyrosine phosphatase
MPTAAHEPLPIIDLHSHLVPAVDDGAGTISESLTALSGLYQEGVRTVVTTPHLLIPHLPSDAAIDQELGRHLRGFESLLEACLGRSDLPDIALGQEIWAPDASAARRVARRNDVGLTGSFLLVEFGFTLQGSHTDVIREVLASGRRILIAHPERYAYLAGQDPLDLMQRWRELGALLQVNVGSLTGHYRRSSPGSDELAWRMAELDLIDVLASDHHGPRRTGVSPAEALTALVARGATALAQRALVEIPGLIIRSEIGASGLPG